jgi:hypothetical protein
LILTARSQQSTKQLLLLRKETRLDRRAFRQHLFPSLKPTSTHRQYHPNSNHYTPPQPSHYSHPALLTIQSHPHLVPSPRSHIRASSRCFSKANLGAKVTFFAPGAPAEDIEKRSLNASPFAPRPLGQPRDDAADPEHCTSTWRAWIFLSQVHGAKGRTGGG